LDVLKPNDPQAGLLESVVGAHLMSTTIKTDCTVYYWREGKHEVDFVLSDGEKLLAIEVKNGWKQNRAGLAAFKAKYPNAKTLLVGDSGIPLADFLKQSGQQWLAFV
jgi:predicted AAA+ superfamily ATPase